MRIDGCCTYLNLPKSPCNAASAGARSVLDWAFLQDAFFAASFDSATYFLAQAPGPKIAAVDAANARTAVIDKTARALAATNNDWVTSWDGVWTLLPGGDGEVSDPTTKAAPGAGLSDGIASGGSSGTQHNAGLIAGLAVGAGGGVDLLALVGSVLHRRKRHGTGFACCGLRVVQDKERAGGYGSATTPGSPNPPQERKEQGEVAAYKYPNYYNPHDLPLHEAPSQLPDNQVTRPLTGSEVAILEESVSVSKEARV